MNAIDLNTATVGTLTQLPGVAKNMAYRIVNYREKHGPFTSWNDLQQVKDFPIERLEEIKTRAVLRPFVQPELPRETRVPGRHSPGRYISVRHRRF